MSINKFASAAATGAVSGIGTQLSVINAYKAAYNSNSARYNMIENYIYLYHTDTWIILPAYPESITDTLSVEFSSTTPLSSAAPIYSFKNSGPRKVQVSLNLHRDLMSQINYNVSNANVLMGDDYVDTLIKQVQAAALPAYAAASKMVDPPIIAIRFGNEIFCKGVIDGQISLNYEAPILDNGKYAQVSIQFHVNEIDPYDAMDVMQAGSFRGISTSLERKLWKV